MNRSRIAVNLPRIDFHRAQLERNPRGRTAKRVSSDASAGTSVLLAGRRARLRERPDVAFELQDQQAVVLACRPEHSLPSLPRVTSLPRVEVRLCRAPIRATRRPLGGNERIRIVIRPVA